MDRQTEAARYIRNVLLAQGFDIEHRLIIVEEGQQWLVFERGECQIAIDSSSGIWVKGSAKDIWRCFSKTCTTSSALLAIEILVGD